MGYAKARGEEEGTWVDRTEKLEQCIPRCMCLEGVANAMFEVYNTLCKGLMD